MERENRSETVFCHSCGEVIKKAADVCPECGVANEYKPSTSGTETVFCHSCGEEIKKKAAVCPECGVRNNHNQSATAPSTTTDSRKVKISAPDDSTTTGTENISAPDESTTAHENEQERSGTGTDALNKWTYLSAIAVACGLIWTFTSAGFGFFFISWFLIPFAVYHDAKHVQPATGWNPNRYLWAFLTIYPVLNIFLGLIYTIKRFNSSSVSLTDKLSNTAGNMDNTEECNACTDADSEDAAIEQLRKQYVNGELDDYEFERRLETVVETEDTEAVKERIKEEA